MQLTAHFSLAEFEAASSRKLNADEIETARYFAEQLLEPARRALGIPICITSFLREGDPRTHGEPASVDYAPCDGDPEKLEQIFTWQATYRTQAFGELIHERNHVHVSLPGTHGNIGKVMREPIEGSYVLASIAPVLGILPLLATLALLSWPRKKRRRT